MLAVAKKNLSAFSNIEYHEADGASLPFHDQSLDAIFANMYLHHSPDPLSAIREMVRTLRPGGRLVITDMDEHPYAWLKDELADAWQGFGRDQMRSWFGKTGLVNVIVEGTGQSCCAESARPSLLDPHGREANISIFVATGTRRLAVRDEVKANYSAVATAGSACGCSPSASAGAGSCRSDTTSSSSGCSGIQVEDIAFSTGYTPTELNAAPKEAAEISLGCGNPIAMAALKAGEVVVDIGSGGGLDAFLAAGKVGPTGRVIGVDMTPAMLERARASAARNGFANVEFRQGYAEELPVADASVDVILSNCVINLAEDKGQVFREAFRALKPGGRLEVSDMVTSGAMPLDVQANPGGWSGCITGALPETEYLDLIAQAGFQNVTTRSSASMGEAYGVSIYSAIASAQKPDGVTAAPGSAALGSGCCQ
jgi:ubiquinone/menaquinone biosynthesis C-methylase UbiE